MTKIKVGGLYTQKGYPEWRFRIYKIDGLKALYVIEQIPNEITFKKVGDKDWGFVSSLEEMFELPYSIGGFEV